MRFTLYHRFVRVPDYAVRSPVRCGACVSFYASRAGSTTFVLGPWIEELVATNRGPGIGLGDLAELHSDIAFARIRAHRLRKYANADLELRRHSSRMAWRV